MHRTGKDVTFVTYGTMVDNVLQAAGILETKGISVSVLRLLSLSPMPEIKSAIGDCREVIVVEETTDACSIAKELAKDLPACRVTGLNLGDAYVPHGSIDKLYDHYGLSGQKIASFVQEVLPLEN